MNANIRIQRNTLYADHFDAKCGPRGSIKVRGAVLRCFKRAETGVKPGRVSVARARMFRGASGLRQPVRREARAAYSGRLDADMVIKGTLRA